MNDFKHVQDERLIEGIKWLCSHKRFRDNEMDKAHGFSEKYANFFIKVVAEIKWRSAVDNQHKDQTRDLIENNCEDSEVKGILLIAVNYVEKTIKAWRGGAMVKTLSPEQLNLIKEYARGNIRW